MVKVQHGWEHHSLDQLERATSQPSTPMIPSTPVAEAHGRRRESIYSETSERFFNSPIMQSSPQPFPRAFFPQTTAGHSLQYYPTPTSMATNVPSLAPAAPISPARPGRRSMSSRVPPNLITNRIPHTTSGQPTTPTSNPVRQGILRMPSQQAEKDALETLMFMSSPNNSSNLKHAASAASSPLRSEFPPAAKRVVFDGYR
jgi:Whi5 like